jgi:hypothetical protein
MQNDSLITVTDLLRGVLRAIDAPEWKYAGAWIDAARAYIEAFDRPEQPREAVIGRLQTAATSTSV